MRPEASRAPVGTTPSPPSVWLNTSVRNPTAGVTRITRPNARTDELAGMEKTSPGAREVGIVKETVRGAVRASGRRTEDALMSCR